MKSGVQHEKEPLALKHRIPRVMIAAPRSGGGKTTLTCGLLQLFHNEGTRCAAFKCGPDYIDPLFHRFMVGAQSANLDLFFTDEPTVRSLLIRGSEKCDIALLEGVMGFYDGMSSDSFEGSSYHLAKATETPVILVLDVQGASLSLAAQIQGFLHFQPHTFIEGVILNTCSKALFEYLAPALEKYTGMPLLGYVPKDERFALKSRHLGLVTAEEIEDLQEKMQCLADTLKETVDIEKLREIAQAARPLEGVPYKSEQVTEEKPRLAIAQDRAFCFYYEENVRMLKEMGVELVPFSPLHDQELPLGVDGIYLGGGYPELYAQELSENEGMRRSLYDAAQKNIPIVAECGGFLYLQEAIEDDEGIRWPLLGVVPGESKNIHRLERFGYSILTAQKDTLYGAQGTQIRAHEFHYWQSSNNGDAFRAQKPTRNTTWPCVVARDNLVAGFPHLYYPANPCFAKNFVQKMVTYKTKKESY